jgi:hypothetical protein
MRKSHFWHISQRAYFDLRSLVPEAFGPTHMGTCASYTCVTLMVYGVDNPSTLRTHLDQHLSQHVHRPSCGMLCLVVQSPIDLGS